MECPFVIDFSCTITSLSGNQKGAITVAPLLLIDLETDQGLVGRSYLFGLAPPVLKPLAGLVELMGEMVKGDEVLPFEIEAKLRKRHTLLGVHNIVLFAMSGIDMAAWDVLAQSLKQPLVRLLGGVAQYFAFFFTDIKAKKRGFHLDAGQLFDGADLLLGRK